MDSEIPWYNRLPWWANLVIAVVVLGVLVQLLVLIMFAASN